MPPPRRRLDILFARAGCRHYVYIYYAMLLMLLMPSLFPLSLSDYLYCFIALPFLLIEVSEPYAYI